MVEAIVVRADRLTRGSESLTFAMTTREESATKALRAALVHMNVSAWNIRAALVAYDKGDRADQLRNKRFANGMARELVRELAFIRTLC